MMDHPVVVKEEEIQSAITDASEKETTSEKDKTSYLVICPSSEIFTFGMNTQERPEQIPNIIAYLNTKQQPLLNTEFNNPNIDDSELQKIIDFLKLHNHSDSNTDTWCNLISELNEDECPNLKRSASGTLFEAEGNAKRFLCGDEVKLLTDKTKYEIVHPIQNGHLNKNRSYAQLRTDLSNIWNYAFTQKLKLTNFKDISVVMIISNILSGTEIQLFVDAILTDLGFKEVMAHTESISVTFGYGIPGACIINIEENITRICCIDEGMEIPKTKVSLPYGGQQISYLLYNLIKRNYNALLPNFVNPYLRPCDIFEMRELVLNSCYFLKEDMLTNIQQQNESENQNIVFLNLIGKKNKKLKYELKLSQDLACIAPTAIFYPYIFYNETHIEEKYIIPDLSSELSPIEKHYKSIIEDEKNKNITNVSKNEKSVLTKENENKNEKKVYVCPLDRAIVESISAVPRAEVRRRLYTNMLVMGSYSGLIGLADMLERRVLSALPLDDLTETVAVYEGKEDNRYIIWKGGVLLGTLDFREHWVSRVEWLDIGYGRKHQRKYVKSDIPFSKVFWLYRCETATDT